MLETLYDTQLWNQPYVRENPFLYLTPNKSDFEDIEGRLMLNKFKNIFMQGYKQYGGAVEKWQSLTSE